MISRASRFSPPFSSGRIFRLLLAGILLAAPLALLVLPGRYPELIHLFSPVHGLWIRRSVGPFLFLKTDGDAFRKEEFKGKHNYIFFGFLDCGYGCPTTLARLHALDRELGREDLAFYFISLEVLNPRRAGTLERRLRQYGTHFHGLIPEDQKSLQETASRFSVRADWTGSDPEDHTAFLAYVSPDGDLRVLYTDPLIPPSTLIEDFRSFLASHPTEN